MKKNFKNKNVLIIGGLGLIGSAVTEKFLFEGSSVICVDIQNENSYLDISNLDNFLNNNEEKINDSILNDNSENNKILDHFDKCFSEINNRLENIEKRLYQKESNNNSFYKERKKINTFYSKGKKVVNIMTDVNRDGNFSSKLKTISYDSEGNEEITYKTLKKK